MERTNAIDIAGVLQHLSILIVKNWQISTNSFQRHFGPTFWVTTIFAAILNFIGNLRCSNYNVVSYCLVVNIPSRALHVGCLRRVRRMWRISVCNSFGALFTLPRTTNPSFRPRLWTAFLPRNRKKRLSKVEPAAWSVSVSKFSMFLVSVYSVDQIRSEAYHLF